MAEVQRVPLGRPPAGSWLPGVVTAVVVVLAIAILKPWAPPPSAVAPTPVPTFYIAPVATEHTGPRAYDPVLFGGREPEPAWELWPAGYVVQFGMAGPVRVHAPAGASAEPGTSPVPAASAGPNASSAPSPAEPTVQPLAPGIVDLGPADHLVALGINTPLEARVTDVELWFYRGEDCCLERLDIVRLPTLWESNHFIVIAPGDPDDPGTATAWLVGRYRLDVTTAAGEIREVTFVVRAPQG